MVAGGCRERENVAGTDAKPLVFHYFYCYLATPGPSGSGSAMDSVGMNAEIDEF